MKFAPERVASRRGTGAYVALKVSALLLAGCPGRRAPDAEIPLDATAVDILEDAAADAANDLALDALADATVETAPRAIAPMSSATVTSRQPTFRFRLPPGFTGVSIDVCAERGCASVEQTIAATGESARANAPLAPGVHYWRLRAGAVTSSPWWFWVGVGSAPIDSSFGSQTDVDGDGLPEILVGADAAGAHSEGRVYVYAGTRGAFATTPAMVIDGTESAGRFGWGLSSAGDINGDGYVDVVVGAPHVEAWNGRAYVFHGSSRGLALAPDETLLPPEAMGNFGALVTSAGDVNGDGYADVLVSAPSTNISRGALFVYRGSASGLEPTPSLVLRGAAGPGVEFGSAAASAGDVNADGFGDVVVGSGAANAGGRAHLALMRVDLLKLERAAILRPLADLLLIRTGNAPGRHHQADPLLFGQMRQLLAVLRQF
ncbi:MAG: VCBS repeat-containing protein, partial [Deltaproteobacteria bacterium]